MWNTSIISTVHRMYNEIGRAVKQLAATSESTTKHKPDQKSPKKDDAFSKQETIQKFQKYSFFGSIAMTLFGATVSVIIIRKFREMKRMEDLGYAHDKFEAEMLKKKTPKDRLAEGIRAMLPTELKPYAEHVEAVCKAAPSLLTGKANQRVILIALARQAMVKHPEVIGGTRAGVQAAKARRRERREIDGKERRGPKEGRVQRMIDHLRRRQEIRRLRRMKR